MLESGRKAHPQDQNLALALARLELQEQHPDRAELVLRPVFQQSPSPELAFLLAETLILRSRIEGSDGARPLLDFLAAHGYRENYVRYLDARIEAQQGHWEKAIAKIQSAQAGLASDARVSAQLRLLLAECYGRLNLDEQRVAVLHSASEGSAPSQAAQLELARALAVANRLDEALTLLHPLAQSLPELRLEIARLSIEKTRRQPANERDWRTVERRIEEARKAIPGATEALDLLQADMLSAREQFDEARLLLRSTLARNPRNLPCRLALARLAGRGTDRSEPLTILDQAETELGPHPEIQYARLAFWARQGGANAAAGVARVAGSRKQIPAAELPRFLDQLATAETRLNEPELAHVHLRELSKLEPGNLKVLMGRFDLALAARDETEGNELIQQIREIEGEDGTNWRYEQALKFLDQARRGNRTTRADARALVSEIARRRPGWWGVSLLNAQLAELNNQPEAAAGAYLSAVRQGDQQPQTLRHLLQFLFRHERFADIEELARLLQERGIAQTDLSTIATAITTARQGNASQGLTLLLGVIPGNSTDFGDPLTLGHFARAAGKDEQAEGYFRHATELGTGVPEAWFSCIQFLVDTHQTDKARAALRKAITHELSGPAAATAAVCAMMLGDDALAETQIESSLKADPQDPAALRPRSFSTTVADAPTWQAAFWTDC